MIKADPTKIGKPDSLKKPIAKGITSRIKKLLPNIIPIAEDRTEEEKDSVSKRESAEKEKDDRTNDMYNTKLDSSGESPTVFERHRKPRKAMSRFDTTTVVFLLKWGINFTK